MEEERSLLGLIVIVEVPEPVTWLLVTSMVSMVELSDDFLIVILPLSTSTASEKLRTTLVPTSTDVALSAGVELLKVGVLVSIVVKDRLVILLIPA